MSEIFAEDATETIDPLTIKPRKNPWREKRTNFRTAGPGKPHSSNGKVFLKKHCNRKIRQLPIISLAGETIFPAIKRTIAFDLS